MKRLGAGAVIFALFALPVYAQRATSHGGSSGSRSGFSGSHGGSPARGAPSFHGLPSGAAPGRVAGPPRFAPGTSPISTRGFRPAGPVHSGPSAPYPRSMGPRMPYHSPNGGDRDRSRNGRDHDWDRRRHSFYAWGGIPLWSGWGYPYLPGYLGYSDDYDGQHDSNYAASQPYPDYPSGSYDGPSPDESQSRPYTPWPYSAQPAPYNAEPSSAPATEIPVTLVFKDGRPPQQIHNYLLTSTTLSVIDQQHRDIPVDQIDLDATAKVNRDAGVEFGLPGGGSR
jgi:hypothetical protein